MQVILAIDGGTESVRVGLIDRSGGLVAQAAAAYPTTFPRSGWAEQDPADWWRALCAAARQCLSDSPATQVAGICSDATTCTLLPLGRDRSPLRRALLWMDVRASDQADRLAATGHPALARYTPAGCSAEWMLPKAMWLAEQEPDVWDRTAYLVEYLDWINYRLTGRLTLNRNTATQRWLYNAADWLWPTDLFAAVGLPALADRFPDHVIGAGERVGALANAAAADLGLRPGIPVFQGGGDAFVALPGLGVAGPGELGLIAGSSNVVACFTEHRAGGPGVFGSFPEAMVPGLELVEAGQASAGSVLAWFRRELAADLPEDGAYETLDSEAAEIPPGSGGLVVLESFQGNRTPHTDSRVRGAIWGLSLSTTRAQIFRAVMEGVAYGLHTIVETLRSHGVRADGFRACGGITRSPLFLQIIADVCGMPVSTTRVVEATLVGCGILASVGLGWHPDIGSAASSMTAVGAVHEPEKQAHLRYLPYGRLYRKSYLALQDVMHEAVDAN